MIPEKDIAKSLILGNKTLCIAESCTGGLLANRLTDIPGSSQFLKLGVVAYSNDAKVKLLKVPRKIIMKYGAVSSQTARIMSQNIRKILKADFGIAITGIAGPTGATKNKPVGLTYISVSAKNKTKCSKFIFKGKRTLVKSQATDNALRILLNFI